MRLLFGIVIGVALTIGAAYVHDTKVRGPLAEQRRRRGLARGLARYEPERAQLIRWCPTVHTGRELRHQRVERADRGDEHHERWDEHEAIDQNHRCA